MVSLHGRLTEERRSTSRRRRLTTRALADFGGALTGNLSPFAYDSCVVSERSFARSTAPLRFAPNRLRLRFLARPLVRRVRCASLHCHALSLARVRPRGRTLSLARRSAVLARRSTTRLRFAPVRLPLSRSQDRSLVAFGSLRSPATLGSFATAFRSASRNALTRLLAEVALFVPALLRHAAARSLPNSLNARPRRARSSPTRTRPSLSERDDASSLRARRRNPRPRLFTSVFCPECHRHGSYRALAFVRFATDHCRSHYARSGLACRYPCEITPNAPSVRLPARTRTSRRSRPPRGYRRTSVVCAAGPSPRVTEPTTRTLSPRG